MSEDVSFTFDDYVWACSDCQLVDCECGVEVME